MPGRKRPAAILGSGRTLRTHYSELIAAPIGSSSVGLELVRSGRPSAGKDQVFVVLAADPELQP